MDGPWGLQSRKKLALAAVEFFYVNRITELGEADGARRAVAWEQATVARFIDHLILRDVFEGRTPSGVRVTQILNEMERLGILVKVKTGGLGGDVYLYFGPMLDMKAVTSAKVGRWRRSKEGILWLAPLLGTEFLYDECETGIVHITGSDGNGERRGGTGTVVGTRTVLTARHVVVDMTLDPEQNFQGNRCQVLGRSIARNGDLALVHVDVKLERIRGIALRRPIVGERVVVLGYPQIPATIHDPPVTMHSGEVTSGTVTLNDRSTAFLYSATTRPGNSGGPILSGDGYLVGVASRDLTQCRADEQWFVPHYSAVPADSVAAFLQDKDRGNYEVFLPFEPQE